NACRDDRQKRLAGWARPWRAAAWLAVKRAGRKCNANTNRSHLRVRPGRRRRSPAPCPPEPTAPRSALSESAFDYEMPGMLHVAFRAARGFELGLQVAQHRG